MSLSPNSNGLHRRRRTLPSTARRLRNFASRQYSKLASEVTTLPYSIYRSRSLWGCSYLFSCMIFFWNGVFLSASTSRSILLLLLFSFCRGCTVPAGQQKSDTSGCHWQLEVNVIRRPLPRTAGSGLLLNVNACTRGPDQNVCVTSRSMWERVRLQSGSSLMKRRKGGMDVSSW